MFLYCEYGGKRMAFLFKNQKPSIKFQSLYRVHRSPFSKPSLFFILVLRITSISANLSCTGISRLPSTFCQSLRKQGMVHRLRCTVLKTCLALISWQKILWGSPKTTDTQPRSCHYFHLPPRNSSNVHEGTQIWELKGQIMGRSTLSERLPLG